MSPSTPTATASRPAGTFAQTRGLAIGGGVEHPADALDGLGDRLAVGNAAP